LTTFADPSTFPSVFDSTTPTDLPAVAETAVAETATAETATAETATAETATELASEDPAEQATETPGAEAVEVTEAAETAAPVLGFAPSVRMEGLLDTDVPKETADHVVAVLSEALTNVARHAHADRADVLLATDGREVRLSVTDNGVGTPADGRRSGLRNMAERAEQLGGGLELGKPESGGTALVWRVPTRKP
jgi:signal transduction histidine kinase